MRIAFFTIKNMMIVISTRPTDTAQMNGLDEPKSAPAAVVRTTLDALEAGASWVLADDIARRMRSGLSADPAVYLQAITR